MASVDDVLTEDRPQHLTAALTATGWSSESLVGLTPGSFRTGSVCRRLPFVVGLDEPLCRLGAAARRGSGIHSQRRFGV